MQHISKNKLRCSITQISDCYTIWTTVLTQMQTYFSHSSPHHNNPTPLPTGTTGNARGPHLWWGLLCSSCSCDCGQWKERLQLLNPIWSLPPNATAVREQRGSFRVLHHHGSWEDEGQMPDETVRQWMSWTCVSTWCAIHWFCHWCCWNPPAFDLQMGLIRLFSMMEKWIFYNDSPVWGLRCAQVRRRNRFHKNRSFFFLFSATTFSCSGTSLVLWPKTGIRSLVDAGVSFIWGSRNAKKMFTVMAWPL